MKRILQIVGGLVVLCVCMMMIVVIGGGGDDGPTEEEAEPEPTKEAEPEPTGELSVTDFVQSAEEKGWTDAQLSTYFDTLEGQEIKGWSGTVVEIDKYVGEPYFSLEVKEGEPAIDVYLYVTEEDMLRVVPGQDVTFDGTVREEWLEGNGLYALQIENATLVELGEAPPTAVPTIESSPTSETQVAESSNQALFTEAPETIGNSREAWESRFGQGTKGSFGYSYEGPYRVTVSYWGDYLNYVDIQWSEVVSWDEANAVINGYIPSDVTWLEYYRSDSGRYVDLYSSNRLADRLSGEYEEQGVRPGLLIVSYLEEGDGVIDAIIATPAEVDLIGSQALANDFEEPAQPTQAPQTEQEQPAGGAEEQAAPTEAPLPTLAPEPTNPPFTCIGGCATPPDPSCSIKGNVNPSNNTWIYHVEGGAFYNRTDIKPEEGDRWFCTWQEAEAAGFRASER